MSVVVPMSSREWSFGPIPEDWSAIPLKFLCTRSSQYGANLAAEAYEQYGVRFLRTTDINDDGTLEEGGVLVPSELVTSHMLAEGDFLISRSGTVGRAYIYRREHGPCAYAGYLVRYSLRDPDVSQWLFHLTKSPGFQQWLGASAIEATIGNVNGEKYANLLVPIPPPRLRRAISDYLNHEMARMDVLVAAKERVLGLLAEKRRALITRAVTRGLDPRVSFRYSGIPWLGEIPAHWAATRLKFVAEVRGGLTIGQRYGTTELVELPYLRVANVQDGRLDLSDVSTVLIPPAEAASCMLVVGDVLMNEGGDADKLGRGCVWRGEIEPCLHQNHVFAVRPRKVLSDWLNTWTSTDVAKAFFESRAKQSTNLASISATNINELPIPLPPSQEQGAILDHVSGELAKLTDLYFATERTVALLKERRAALIEAAVTGQINVERAT